MMHRGTEVMLAKDEIGRGKLKSPTLGDTLTRYSASPSEYPNWSEVAT